MTELVLTDPVFHFLQCTVVEPMSERSGVKGLIVALFRLLLVFPQHGSRKRRIKLVVDREYETSSTGDESLPESQRGRAPAAHNSLINGSIYVSQNGSIIRTRRSANAADPTANSLKPSSPVFSSRLTKHFKKLDKMAATLEERVPLNSPDSAAEGGGRILRTFQSSRNSTLGSSSSHDVKAVNVLNTRQSSASSGSTSNGGPESAAPKSEPEEVSGGRREESKGESDGDGGVRAEPLECPSDRTQSDEEELWMGPWNSLHIPMTKL